MTKQIKEYLMVPGLGYLKFPKSVKDHYGSTRDFPNPACKVVVNGNKLQITYEFVIKQKEEKV